MKILVTGSNGMVGHAIKEVFKEHQLILTDIAELDVRDYNKVMDSSYCPDLIIHLAAETNLERCEANPSSAYMTNHTGTMNITLLAKALNIPIVYISTAGIFDGKKEAYTEIDNPNPINHYGRSKWYGELAVLNHRKHWICRAGWMMGGGPEIDKKFVNLVFKQIKSGVEVIYAIDNVYGSPTYTYDLANTIKSMIENTPYGIYNTAGHGIASRYDVAVEIVKCLNADVRVIPVKDGYFKDFTCIRSASEVLDTIKLPNSVSKMRDWHISLKEYMKCYTL